MSGKILKVFLSMCMVVFCQANSALAQERPDIELIRIEFRPSKPAALSPVFCRFVVMNRGTAETGPFPVTLSLYGRKVKTWDIDNLGPGGRKQLEYEFTPVGTTTVKVLAIADPYGAVRESDESNNLQRLEIRVSAPYKPDIELTRIEFRPKEPAAGSPVSFHFGVRNRGSAETGAFQVTLSLYGRKVKTWDINNLAPSGKKQLEYEFTPGGTSSVKVLAIADPYGAVQESDESNNLQRLEIQVSKPFRPDIELIRIESRPRKPAAGSPVSLQFGVRNRGAAKTGPFQVTLSLYGRKVKTWDVENLIPAGRKKLEYEFTPFGTMPVKVLLIADPYGTVQESDESNNLQRLEIPVSPPYKPDIELTRIEFRPSKPAALSPVFCRFVVMNRGTAETGPFQVTLSLYGRKVKTWDIDKLGPGGKKQLEYEFTPVGTTTVKVLAIADPYGAVQESDESNNLQRREIQVSPPRQPDIELTEIGCYPDEPVAGSPINFLFNVKNNGNVKVGPFRVVMSINGREVKTWDLDGLINVRRLRFQYTPATPGTLKVLVIADANNSIKESNESNNLQLTTIQVK